MCPIDDLCVNTLRLLGVDMINKAKSGHPGIVLGAAPIVHTLFTKHLNIDPKNPDWFDRDRFILSAGHGSALLYAALHLSGFEVSLSDLKDFRQLNSVTAGHPEYGHTAGVEMTTGPLGQGISSAVGMAIAEKFLASKFNKYEQPIVSHQTYVLCGDGDLQEGVTMEACSLAGHLALNSLIVLYDSNDVQLDGDVNLTNTESVKDKFLAMNWNYILVEDANDLKSLNKAIYAAKEQTLKPTLIEVKSIIGYGSPVSGESTVHGSPLGEEYTNSLKEYLGYNFDEFEVTSEVYEYYRQHVLVKGNHSNSLWASNLIQYKEVYPEEYNQFIDFLNSDYTINLEGLPEFVRGTKISTRKAMGQILNNISQQLPNILGGSADLTPSTLVRGADGIFDKDNLQGRNIKFGVREHAMAAIVNGLNLHQAIRGYCGGFFVFSDYMKPAIRLAAIMKLNSIFLFSHDSVNVGEDGPTHQPVEQSTMLRSIPNCNVIRPADAIEMTAAMQIAFESKTSPTCVLSTRQDVTNLEGTSIEETRKGAYIVHEPQGKITGILIACGSEVELCVNAAIKLEEENEFVRVVSMPSMFLFDQQSKEYKEKILPSNITKRLAVEMGSTMPWYKYSSKVLGIDTFGISAPLKHIASYFGFTIENVCKLYKEE